MRRRTDFYDDISGSWYSNEEDYRKPKNPNTRLVKYWWSLDDKPLHNEIKFDIASAILEKAGKLNLNVEDYTPVQIKNFISEFVPDKKYLKLLYNKPKKGKENQELMLLKNSVLHSLWNDFEAYRDYKQ